MTQKQKISGLVLFVLFAAAAGVLANALLSLAGIGSETALLGGFAATAIGAWATARYALSDEYASALCMRRIIALAYVAPGICLLYAAAIETADMDVPMVGNTLRGLAIGIVGFGAYMGANDWASQKPVPLHLQAVALCAAVMQAGIAYELTGSGLQPAFTRELFLSPAKALATTMGLLMLLTLWFAERQGMLQALRTRA